MWKNYLLVALRNLSRHRLYSGINIIGLAIGLGGCLLISGYVANELSFERCHANRDRIYRVATVLRFGETTIPFATATAPLAQAMTDELPEVEAVTCLHLLKDQRMEIAGESFGVDRIIFATPEITDIFTLPLKRGETSIALREPSTILLSEELATRCFGSEDPVGRTVKVSQIDCRVSGVLKSIPANTQLRCDAVVSFGTLERMGIKTNTWGNYGEYYVYSLLRQDPDVEQVAAKVSAIAARHIPKEDSEVEFVLQPLSRIYLHTHFNAELGQVGNLTYVQLLSGIAIILLVLAGINFVNLATARTLHRVREVAVRKVFGAHRRDLIRQFIGESICLTAVAMVLGIALFEIAKPRLEAFIGRELPIGLLSSPLLSATMLGMVVAVGVIAGSYPAFFLSRYQPSEAMRRDSGRTGTRSGLRRTFVVVQFATTIALIVATLAIFRQTNLFRVKDLGFRHENMLALSPDDESREKCALLRDEIRKTNRFEGVSAMWGVPGSGWLSLQELANPDRPDQQKSITPVMWVDENFIPTLGITLREGRNFSDQHASDQENAIVVNEAAIRDFGLDNPIGKTLVDSDQKPYPIIGVIKDFHSGSLRDRIGAAVLKWQPARFASVVVRLPSSDIAGSLGAISAIWKQVIPDHPMEYRMLDDIIAGNYERERKTGSLFIVFSILAAFIGCLGMFGLASFAAERRTKEIGIRKVLGASVSSVVRILAWEFVVLVAIANLVAWPIAYCAVQRWLQGFAYRIDMNPDMFIYAGLMALLIALLTVGWQALRAARANPVDSLKYE